MIARKNRKYRDSGPMFPFGDIMLPIIGIVALGLLIVGIKMFFMPAKADKEYMPVTVSAPPSKQVDVKERKVVPFAKGTTKAGPVAIPVPPSETDATHVVKLSENGGSSSEVQLKGVNTVTSAKEKDIETKTVSEPKVTSSENLSSSARTWNVQIGSFLSRKSAEQEASRAGKAGFNADVLSIDVNGKTYHRVYVRAGLQRSDAVLMEKKLKGKGFPTFIIRY